MDFDKGSKMDQEGKKVMMRVEARSTEVHNNHTWMAVDVVDDVAKLGAKVIMT